MLTPPLQLRHYFFDYISVEANENFELEVEETAAKTSDARISSETNIGTRKGQEESPTDFMVVLTLTVSSKASERAPYDIKLAARGFFDVSNEVPVEERHDVVSITGVSMLYGASREFLLGVTSRLGNGPYSLPTVSFRDNRVNSADEERESNDEQMKTE